MGNVWLERDLSPLLSHANRPGLKWRHNNCKNLAVIQDLKKGDDVIEKKCGINADTTNANIEQEDNESAGDVKTDVPNLIAKVDIPLQSRLVSMVPMQPSSESPLRPAESSEEPDSPAGNS